MKKLLLILIALPIIGFGQGWQQNYGSVNSFEAGISVQQTLDGGYIVLGISAAGSSEDAYLMKIDGNGNTQWSQTFGGVDIDRGDKVQQTLDGGYILSLSRRIEPAGGIPLLYIDIIKTYSNGTIDWNTTFPCQGEGTHIQQTIDGGYIIAGGFESGALGALHNIPGLVKIDSIGNQQWSQVFSALTNLFPSVTISVQQTTDGGYIVCPDNGGQYSPTNGDVNIIKTHSDGTIDWYKSYGGNDYSAAPIVSQTTDGGYIIGGRTKDFVNDDYDAYLIKTDSIGAEQWSKIFGGNLDDRFGGIEQTTDGGYVIVGNTESLGDTLGDIYIIKTDGNGVEQWHQTYGGSGFDGASSVQQTNDGGYIICGTMNYDICLIKTDGQGNATSTFSIPINPNRKLEKVTDILGRKTKEKTNQPLFYIYDDGTAEKRIVIE